MEPELVGLASIHLQTVYKVIVIVHEAVLAQGRGKLYVEDVYVVVIQVHIGMQMPGKLGQRVIFLYSRYPAGIYDFPGKRRVLLPVVPCR